MNEALGTRLRTAKQEAQKKGIDFPQRFQQELRGYDGESVRDLEDIIPEYRLIATKIEAFNPYHGWQPVHFENNEIANLLLQWPIGISIPEIEALLDSEAALAITMDPKWEKSIINGLPIPLQIQHSINRHSIHTVLIKVEADLDDWLDENNIDLNIEAKISIKNNQDTIGEGQDIDIGGDKNIGIGAGLPNISGNHNIIITDTSLLTPGITIGEDAKGDSTSIVIGNGASVNPPPLPKSSQIIKSVGEAIKDVGVGIKKATPSAKSLLLGDGGDDNEEAADE